MKSLFFLKTILSVTLVASVGCGSLDDPQKLESKALAEISSLREFSVLYPDPFVNLSTRALREGKSTAEVSTIVYDRYRLMLQVDFEFEPKTHNISRQGIPRLRLDEIISVRGKPEGPIGIDYGKETLISQKDWEKIVAFRGDFIAAGIHVDTNAPVAGIELLKHYFKKEGAQ